MSHLLKLSFKEEDAVVDGVSLDAYSAFYESLYTKMDGSFEKLPSSNLDEEEGKIINHGPLELSKSTLKYSIFGSVDNDEPFASFVQFIPPIAA